MSANRKRRAARRRKEHYSDGCYPRANAGSRRRHWTSFDPGRLFVKHQRTARLFHGDIRRQGLLIAQADHMPIHIGSLLWGLRAVLAALRSGEIAEGDAFVMNDPYLAGGTHLPDISVLTPVFARGRLTHFVGNIAHHADVGGPVAGSVSGQSPDIFWEGIRLPPIRIARGGEPDNDVIDLIASNTRAPIERQLDLRTQIGANQTRRGLTGSSNRRVGLADVEAAGAGIIAHTRERIQAGLRDLKDGKLERDALSRRRRCRIRPCPAMRDRVSRRRPSDARFRRFRSRSRWRGQSQPSSLEATVAYCIKALIDPEVAANSGLLGCRRDPDAGTQHYQSASAGGGGSAGGYQQQAGRRDL